MSTEKINFGATDLLINFQNYYFGVYTKLIPQRGDVVVKQLRIILVVIMIIFTMFFLMSCSNIKKENPAPAPEGPTKQEEEGKSNGGENQEEISLKEYFPLTEGSRWKYIGEGNEFASFTREVLYVKGDRAQIIENNGGTVSASVFEVTDEEIVRIFFQGEEYEATNFLDVEPNDNFVILKKPLKIGTKWETPQGSREIVEIDATVDTPAGKFEDCVVVSISQGSSTSYEYYKQGVGMVKREFVSEGITVMSTLEEYEIK